VRNRVKYFSKAYKVAIDFQRAMLCLLIDGLECMNVFCGPMHRFELCLSPISKVCLLKLSREFHMKGCSIELFEHVAHHDCSVVVLICAGA
jgi:hypothetical protein